MTRRRKRHSPEQTVHKLPAADAMLKTGKDQWPCCRPWKPGNRRSSAGEPVRRQKRAFRATRASCARRRAEADRANASVGATAAAFRFSPDHGAIACGREARK